jgi:hypothetical protein
VEEEGLRLPGFQGLDDPGEGSPLLCGQLDSGRRLMEIRGRGGPLAGSRAISPFASRAFKEALVQPTIRRSSPSLGGAVRARRACKRAFCWAPLMPPDSSWARASPRLTRSFTYRLAREDGAACTCGPDPLGDQPFEDQPQRRQIIVGEPTGELQPALVEDRLGVEDLEEGEQLALILAPLFQPDEKALDGLPAQGHTHALPDPGFLEEERQDSVIEGPVLIDREGYLSDGLLERDAPTRAAGPARSSPWGLRARALA